MKYRDHDWVGGGCCMDYKACGATLERQARCHLSPRSKERHLFYPNVDILTPFLSYSFFFFKLKHNIAWADESLSRRFRIGLIFCRSYSFLQGLWVLEHAAEFEECVLVQTWIPTVNITKWNKSEFRSLEVSTIPPFSSSNVFMAPHSLLLDARPSSWAASQPPVNLREWRLLGPPVFTTASL